MSISTAIQWNSFNGMSTVNKIKLSTCEELLTKFVTIKFLSQSCD